MNDFYFIPTQAVYCDGSPFYLPVKKSSYDDFISCIKHLGYSCDELTHQASSSSIYHYVEIKPLDNETDS